MIAVVKMVCTCVLCVYAMGALGLQLLDWNGGLEWWNGGMEWWNRKFSKNQAKRSYFLMHEDINSDLMASLAYTEVKCLS